MTLAPPAGALPCPTLLLPVSHQMLSWPLTPTLSLFLIAQEHEFHDHEGFSTLCGTKSFGIMKSD